MASPTTQAGSGAPAEPPLTLMCNFAFVSKLRVVCLLVSGPSGTSPFSFSKHSRRWARLEEHTTHSAPRYPPPTQRVGS